MRTIPFVLLSTLAIPTFLFGCTAASDEGDALRLLRAPADANDLDDCENVEEVCTASYPAMCFLVCADGDDTCVPVEECPAIYPSTCTTRCETDGDDNCAISYDAATGDEVIVCYDGGGTCSSDDPSCGGGSEPGNPGPAPLCTTADDCELTEVPAICRLCDDGSCASPTPACREGQCAIDWVCADEPECRTAADCTLSEVPAICQICSDESCASAAPACNAGRCGIEWVCPG